MENQICNICGKSLPATSEFFSFYSNKRNGVISTGLRGTCKRCMADRTAKHSKEYPDLVKARVERRKVATANAEGKYELQDIANIRAHLGDRCHYCGTALNGKGDIDHIVPISKGGTNWPKNLTLACKTCNLDKHAKSAEEFFQWRIQRSLPVRHELMTQNSVSTSMPPMPKRVIHVRKKP